MATSCWRAWSKGKNTIRSSIRRRDKFACRINAAKRSSSILRTPKAWAEACKKGHLQTILTFVERCAYFKYACREFHDTPLHHVKFEDYSSYQELLQRPLVRDRVEECSRFWGWYPTVQSNKNLKQGLNRNTFQHGRYQLEYQEQWPKNCYGFIGRSLLRSTMGMYQYPKRFIRAHT